MTSKYDVVIVGAANAALCAAHAARERVERVLVLEKAPREQAGGNTFFTAGAFRVAYGTLEQARPLLEGLTDEMAARVDLPPYREADFLADLVRMTEGRCDPALAGLLTGDSFETVRWMHGKGIRWELMFARQSFPMGDRFRFFGGLALGTVGGGKGLLAQHLEAARRAGIEIRYDSPAVGLLAVADREEAGPADPAPLSIEVFAVTPAGRPASIGDLKLSAARGAVSLARAERPGVFRLSYRAPEDGGGADTVTVRAFGSSDALRIRLLPRAEPEPTVQHPTSSAAAHAASTLVRPAAASSKRSPFPFAFAAGMLLRAQSNLSHANGGGAAFELSGKLPRPPLAGIERLEAIARLEGFAFAAQTQQGPAPGDPLRRGSLQAFSLATGLRATVLTVGPADLHAAALAGALRSFDTVRVVGGPADGVQQQSARWGPLLATAGGASMRLGRGRVLAEAQFAFSPARGQLQGNLGGLSLSAGYLLDFN